MVVELYNVKLSNNGQIVYDENLISRQHEDNLEQDMRDYISFIRPWLKYNYILISYVRDLRVNEL